MLLACIEGALYIRRVISLAISSAGNREQCVSGSSGVFV
jgi:hypothetical protein